MQNEPSSGQRSSPPERAGGAESTEKGCLDLTAYQLWRPALRIVPAPLRRAWMTDLPEHFAYRCLPMCAANEHGWFILSDQTVDIVWRGAQSAESLEIDAHSTVSKNTPISHFGSGIVTWRIPYVFRTPQGYDLLVRGPSNSCRDGISALDGVVEADWAAAPFTVNWKVTRPNYVIRFEEGEPIAMIMPIRHAEIEEFTPRIVPVQDDREISDAHQEWSRVRGESLAKLRNMTPDIKKQWDRHYWEGFSVGSSFKAEQHRTHLRVKEFDRSASE